jgi:hypothetical protein
MKDLDCWRLMPIASACAVASVLLCSSSSAHSGTGELLRHEVRQGDTLISLAEHYLGSGGRWRALSSLNHVADPRRLVVGSSVRIPIDAMPSKPETARVLRVRGAVSVVRKGADHPVLLAVDNIVAEGDALTVAHEGFAALALGDGTIVHVQANTTLRINRLRKLSATGAARVSIGLDGGRIDSVVHPVAPGGRFDVTTPLAVAGVRGTRFGVTARSDGGVTLDVLKGSVAFNSTSIDGEELVTAGRGSIAVPGAKALTTRAIPEAPDLTGVPSVFERPVISVPLPNAPLGSMVHAQLARDPEMLDVLQSKVTPERPIQFSDVEDGNYFLAVRIADADGLMGRQTVVPIRLTARPEPPWPAAPGADAHVLFDQVALSCTDVQGAESYHLQLSRTIGFEQITAEKNGQAKCAWDLPPLTEGNYFWRAATVIQTVRGSSKRGPFSDASEFVAVHGPSAPRPEVSEDDAGNGVDGGVASKAIVHWQGSAGARYEIQTAQNADFTLNALSQRLGDPTAQIVRPPCAHLFFRVRPTDTDGFSSAYSVVRHLGPPSTLCSGAGTPVLGSDGVRIRTR